MTVKLSSVIKQMRMHQWVKNLLLFVPLGLAHRIQHLDELGSVLLAFVAFSFCASAIYTINDVVDLDADRQHPTKRNRPIPSGTISIPLAFVLSVLLIVISGVIAVLWTNVDFIGWLAIYFVVTTLYSFWLKKLVLVDVITLALLYVLRIEAGAEAASVTVSPWLLAFSLFLFSSLAFLKRYTELLLTVETEQTHAARRGYERGDADFTMVAGTALGFIAILVLTLYISSADVQKLYNHPYRLWYIIPFLTYWIAHLWLTSHRGKMHDDPILFAIKDLRSYLVMAASIAVMVWASLP